MGFTLHLGIIDLPYAVHAPRRVLARTRRGGKPVTSTAPAAGAQTTSDVARYLEKKYNLMEIFYEETAQIIGDSICQSMADAFDNLVDTGRAPERIFPQEGQPEIQVEFNRFIDLKKIDGIEPGVPTKAALAGVNHRLGLKKGPERPSFKDTGLLESSFRAWVEES